MPRRRVRPGPANTDARPPRPDRRRARTPPRRRVPGRCPTPGIHPAPPPAAGSWRPTPTRRMRRRRHTGRGGPKSLPSRARRPRPPHRRTRPLFRTDSRDRPGRGGVRRPVPTPRPRAGIRRRHPWPDSPPASVRRPQGGLLVVASDGRVTLRLEFEDRGIRNYVIGVGNEVSAEVSIGAGEWVADGATGSGTIQVTGYAPSFLEGSFELSLEGDDPSSMVVTSGRFVIFG